jgi:hypothetical protein
MVCAAAHRDQSMRYQYFVAAMLSWTLSLGSSDAHATIVLANDPSLNLLGAAQDGQNLTIDVENGLEWLDFTLTLNRSYNDVSADLADGQPLAGWRYATEQDFLNIAASANIPAANIDVLQGPGPVPELIFLAEAWGLTIPWGRTLAVSGEAISPGFHRLAGVSAAGSGTTAWLFDAPNNPTIWGNQVWNDNNVHPEVGHALVRIVPEPATTLLLGLGLLALAMRSRLNAALRSTRRLTSG